MKETAPNLYEFEPQYLQVAEIGTGGLDTGYNLLTLPNGSTIVTIDLLDGRGASSNHHDATKVPGLYARKAEQLGAMGESVAEFQHIPVFADGREAPFKDSSFDYVLLSSVISDPGVEASDAARLIEEALRIVKDEGMVILRDDLTPFVTEDRFAMTNGETDEIFRIIGEDDEEWRASRRANVLVDKVVGFTPTMRMLKKGANLGKIKLNMYDLEEGLRIQRQNMIDAQVAAHRARRARWLAKIGIGRGRISKED